MIKQFKHKNLTWVNVITPTKDEIKNLAKTYNWHYLTVQDLSSIDTDSRVEFYSEYIYLILYWPNYSGCWPDESKAALGKTMRLHLIIGSDYLATIHHHPLSPLEDLSQIFGPPLDLNHHSTTVTTGLLLFYLIQRLHRAMNRGLAQLASQTDHIAFEINNLANDNLNQTLIDFHRELKDFIWPLIPQTSIWSNLLVTDHPVLDQADKNRIKILQADHQALANKINQLKSIAKDLNLNYQSQLILAANQRRNFINRLLIITLPALLLLALLGVNVNMPLLTDHPYAFYLVIGLAGLVAWLAYKLAQSKQWF